METAGTVFAGGGGATPLARIEKSRERNSLGMAMRNPTMGRLSSKARGIVIFQNPRLSISWTKFLNEVVSRNTGESTLFIAIITTSYGIHLS
jgi:hypothetical protein